MKTNDVILSSKIPNIEFNIFIFNNFHIESNCYNIHKKNENNNSNKREREIKRERERDRKKKNLLGVVVRTAPQ